MNFTPPSCGPGNHPVSQVGDAEWRCWRCGADQDRMEREEEEQPLCEVHGTPMTLAPDYQRNGGACVQLEMCNECDEQEEREATTLPTS